MWAAGPGVPPADGDELADRLEAAGAPAHGWDVHPMVPLPSGREGRGPGASRSTTCSAGWSPSAPARSAGRAGGDIDEHVGASLRWFGRIAVWAVQLLARGSLVPVLRTRRPRDGSGPTAPSRRCAGCPGWSTRPASTSWPAPCPARSPPSRAPTATASSTPCSRPWSTPSAPTPPAASSSRRPRRAPAPPRPWPRPSSPGSTAPPSTPPPRAGAEVASRLERWAHPVTEPARGRLVVQLDPPDTGDAWFLSVLGPGPDGRMVPVEVALVDGRSQAPLADELARLERLLPGAAPPRRPAPRRGRTSSQDEAWELMTETGPTLEAAGFDVRVPALSRRKPSRRRCASSPSRRRQSVVGAHQLANVRWSVVFDDVELDAADIARLAAEARPLVQLAGPLGRARPGRPGRGRRRRWPSGPPTTQLTGAEILRHAVGLEGSPLAGGVTRRRQRLGRRPAGARRRACRAEPVADARRASSASCAATRPRPLAWLGFLDARRPRRLPGPRHGPRQDADRAGPPARAPRRAAPALVIAPPAVVGNWAAEAARFTPGLRVVVHHGAVPGRRPTSWPPRSAGADVVHHHLRHRRARRRGPGRAGVGPRRPRRGPGHQEPGQRDGPAAAPHPGPQPPRPHRHARSRTASATSGPSSTSPTRAWSAPGRRSSPSCRPASGDGDAPARRGGAAGPQRAPRVPPHQGRAGRRRRAARPHRRARPLHDDPRADRPLPGRARPAWSTGDRRPAEHRQGEILAAITALKQICNHPAAYQDDGRPLAGRSGKLARLEEIVDAVFAAGERVLIFTHFAEWGEQLADHLTDAHRRARSPATTAAWPAAPATGWSPSSRPARGRARWCCRSRPAAPASTSPPPATSCSTTAGGTRPSRTRPVTGPGASARPARSSSPPPGVPGHGRRAGRGGRGRQAPHRRPGAAEVELAGRPRRRPAPRRPRPAPRRAPGRRRPSPCGDEEEAA